MKTTIFTTEKKEGQFTRSAKSTINQELSAFPDNCLLEWSIREVVKGGFTPTRYKYYFAGLLPSIFPQLRKRYAYRIDGKLQRPKTTTELHEFLKKEFNSIFIIDKETGQFSKEAQSTRDLDDYEFIGQYIESIMVLATSPPYNCNILDYEEWKAKYSKKESHTLVKTN